MPGNLSAAGNSQGTATVIPVGQDCSIFTSVSSSQGCVLPGVGVGMADEYIVANHGSNALSVYPTGSGKIGTLGASTAYSLAAGSALRFLYLGSTNWTQGG